MGIQGALEGVFAGFARRVPSDGFLEPFGCGKALPVARPPSDNASIRQFSGKNETTNDDQGADSMAVTIAANVNLDPRADIDDLVEIGPFCVIGPHVRIGQGTRLENNVTLTGNVALGCRNHLYPGAVIGGAPQDISYRGSETKVIIGDDNIIRENVTINRASERATGVTRVGSHNLFMSGAHVAHDCLLHDHIAIGNGTLLGERVCIFDSASLGAAVVVHPLVSIGSYSAVAPMSTVRHDVPPYMLAEGYPARPRCINLATLKQSNFPLDAIRALTEAHRLLYRAKVGLDHASKILRDNGHLVPQVEHLLAFVQRQHQGLHGRAREHQGNTEQA